VGSSAEHRSSRPGSRRVPARRAVGLRRSTPHLRPARHATGDRWFVDETYVKVAGRWRYLYRAVDQYGQVIDVMMSERRDTTAARRFFIRALAHGPAPVEVTTDKAGPYLRVLDDPVPAAAHSAWPPPSPSSHRPRDRRFLHSHPLPGQPGRNRPGEHRPAGLARTATPPGQMREVEESSARSSVLTPTRPAAGRSSALSQ
jgi:hypothetical protein